MKNGGILAAMEYIDHDLITEAEEVQRGRAKRRWAGWGAAAACLCLVAVGAISILRQGSAGTVTGSTLTGDPIRNGGTVSTDSGSLPGASHTENAGEEHGIVIPPMELPTVSEGIVMDMLGLVVYRGGVYTQSDNYSGAAAEAVEPLLEEYLGYATGSIDEWATQEDYAVEFASSVVGEVYSLRGYDPGFRICVRYMMEGEDGQPQLFIEFLDRLNGITLRTGKDLFEDRLHLRGRVTAVRWQNHDDWNRDGGDFKVCELSAELWECFLDEADHGNFVNTWNPEGAENSIYRTRQQAHLILTMEDETEVRLVLIEGGYVGYEALGWYFVSIPGETFNAVFSACGGNG